MKKVFFDTNILVNWLISTNSCHEDSATLIKRCIQGKIKGYVSSHSLTDVFYITNVRGSYNASPKRSASQMLRIMQALSSEAQEAGVADMSLDEINAEIDAARKGK